MNASFRLLVLFCRASPWLVLLCASMSQARAEPHPSWIVVDDLACPAPHSPTAMALEIERLLLADLPADSPLPQLEVQRAGPRHVVIRLQLTGAASRFQRVLPFSPTDCAAFPQTVVLVTRGVLVRPWDQYAQAISPETSPDSAPRQVRSGLSTPEPSAPPAPPIWHASLLAGGFTGLGSNWLPGFSAAAQLEWTPSRYGLAIQAGADSAVAAARGTQRVDARAFTFAALARVGLLEHAGGALAFFGGPTLRLLDITRDSGAIVQTHWKANPGTLWALRADYRVTPDLGAVASVKVALHRAQRVVVPDEGHVLTVPLARATLRVGVLWDLD